MASIESRRTLPALRVSQWLSDWDEIIYSPETKRRKPDPHFFIFSIPAVELRKLCGIHRRTADLKVARDDNLGIQRQHDEERSEEISRFVKFGFPWSTISEAKRSTDEYDDLRKPGWLPTSVVINIIPPGEKRFGSEVAPDDVVSIVENDGEFRVQMPYSDQSAEWSPTRLPPFEVIDGQHRLFAFSDDSNPDFELPVVAFVGLDISWQAYLFYTINIKPKKINPSLAYDLYPLLRTEDWLDKAEGHAVYRETRSQELTESLWSHPQSPWRDRINMLGERGVTGATQSAWINSLMASLVKPWKSRGSNTGGRFGSNLPGDDDVLGWSRAQQAAFLICAWKEFFEQVKTCSADWAKDLRGENDPLNNILGDLIENTEELPFFGKHSLINSDQGVRGFLYVVNDVFFLSSIKWKLRSWQAFENAGAGDEIAVTAAIDSLHQTEIPKLLSRLSNALITFDWRSSSAPNLGEQARRAKLVFKGSGGYKELRVQLHEHLANSSDEEIASVSSDTLKIIKS